MATTPKKPLRRFQIRVAIDERSGPFFEMLAGLPERSRPSKLAFLAQLAFELQGAMASYAGLASGPTSVLKGAPLSPLPAAAGGAASLDGEDESRLMLDGMRGLNFAAFAPPEHLAS